MGVTVVSKRGSMCARAGERLAFEQRALRLAQMVIRYGRMPPGGEGEGPGQWSDSDLVFLAEVVVPAAEALIRQHRRDNYDPQVAEFLKAERAARRGPIAQQAKVSGKA